VNSETDFVARNEQFQSIVANIAKLALDADGDVVKLGEMPFPGSGHSVSAELTEAIAKIGENMNLRRTETVSVSDGVVESYVHNCRQGRPRQASGILVALESTGDKAALSALGKQLAMHIASDQSAVDRPTTSTRTWWLASAPSSRAGQGIGQAGRNRREDGRRPHAQVLRGSDALWRRCS
jgi:elongation factor Ts